MTKSARFEMPVTEEAWNLEFDLLNMFVDGLIETCGVDKYGHALIRVTDTGRTVYESFKSELHDGDK